MSRQNIPVSPAKDLSSELLIASMDALHVGMILLDAGGRIGFWNDWMVRMSALSFEEVVGRTLDELFPEQADGRLVQAVNWALKNGLPSLLSPSLNRRPSP